MRTVTVLMLGVLLSACNPYVAAVSMTYGVATDERSVSTQASDTEIEGQITAALVASPVQGVGTLDVTCRQGVVVLAGVIPPSSPAAMQAVQIARATPGVKRVETFFVAYRPSITNDLEIKAKIKEAFVADPNIISGRVDIAVYAGHVVLVGVVPTPESAQEFVNDAAAVNGVVSVRSYIQQPQ
jgi:osmotically-inducible protein OsmY